MGPIFLFLVVVAIVVGALTGRLEELTLSGMLGPAKSAVVDIAIPLVGMMAFFLGWAEVLKQAGLMKTIARALAPVFRRLFPEVPDGHPALSMITLNISANMLGLGNAATPFGIEAMRRLDQLNPQRGTSTDAMVLFLAMNTSGVALVPSGVISTRAVLGSQDPAGIMFSSWIATGISTTVAIIVALFLARLFRGSRPTGEVDASVRHGEAEKSVLAIELEMDDPPAQAPPLIPWRAAASVAVFGLVVALGLRAFFGALESDTFQIAFNSVAKGYALPLLVLFGMLYGWSRGVPVYAAMIKGGKQGFQLAVVIIPFLVTILAAVGMFRFSGAMGYITDFLGPWTTPLGFPAEALPMALVRPLSGQGAYGVMAEIMQTHGPDSFIGYFVSTLNGSTETTFYTLAVYGGAVGLRRTRHTVPACLAGDLAGAFGTVVACQLLFA